MPLAARVTRMALHSQRVSARVRAASISASVSVGRSVARDSSAALGLMMSAAPYLAKSRALESTINAAPVSAAMARQALITAGVTTPLP